MAHETSPDHPLMQEFLRYKEEKRAEQRPEEVEALRQSYLRLLAAYSPVVEDFKPGELAREVNEDLSKFGHDTLRLVNPETLQSVRWKDGKPQGPCLDILATHRKSGFTTVFQFDNRVPLRGKAEGVNLLSPPPDLALFSLCNAEEPYASDKLATAVRDVRCDFLVFWIAEAGVMLTPDERDVYRLDKKSA